MVDSKWKSDTARQSVLNQNATLANGVRFAGDYDNDTPLDLLADIFLTVNWDGTAPTAGDEVAQLWILPEDGSGNYPDGGDGTTGTDDDPQAILFKGSFFSINPHLSVDERLCLPLIVIHPLGNRFVLKNVSGQTFDTTWELWMKPHKYQSV